MVDAGAEDEMTTVVEEKLAGRVTALLDDIKEIEVVVRPVWLTELGADMSADVDMGCATLEAVAVGICKVVEMGNATDVDPEMRVSEVWTVGNVVNCLVDVESDTPAVTGMLLPVKRPVAVEEKVEERVTVVFTADVGVGGPGGFDVKLVLLEEGFIAVDETAFAALLVQSFVDNEMPFVFAAVDKGDKLDKLCFGSIVICMVVVFASVLCVLDTVIGEVLVGVPPPVADEATVATIGALVGVPTGMAAELASCADAAPTEVDAIAFAWVVY